MKNKNLLTFIVLIVTAVNLAIVASKCNQCLNNGVACLNETSFSICYGPHSDIIDTTQVMSCPTKEVCTGLSIICAPAAQTKPVCGEATGCSVCDMGGFTCTSRSMFALCSQNNITNVTGKCPHGLVCDTSSSTPNICVKSCGADVTCDIDDPVA